MKKYIETNLETSEPIKIKDPRKLEDNSFYGKHTNVDNHDFAINVTNDITNM